jgi:hypothetical protein
MEISLILPTRQRTSRLRQALDSLAATACRPDRIEIVLYVDLDDHESRAFSYSGLTLKTIVGPRARMGEMTRACYAASVGRAILLANDDICFRTPGWDTRMLGAADRWSDGLGLVWGNDLCSGGPAHPLLPRPACELLGKICPVDFARLHIDTHVYDVFRRLKQRGHDRMCYLPDTIIEHMHVEVGKGEVDETAHNPHRAADLQCYIDWAEERERLAYRLARRIESGMDQSECPVHDDRAGTTDPVITRASEATTHRRIDWGTQLKIVPRLGRMLAKQLQIKQRAFEPVHERRGEGVPRRIRAWGAALTAPARKVKGLLRFLRRTTDVNREAVARCWERLSELRRDGIREAALFGDGDIAGLLVALGPSAGVLTRGACPFEPGMPVGLENIETWDERRLAAWQGKIVIASLVNTEARIASLEARGIPRERLVLLR